jgi:hypothetical protein
MVLSRMVLGIGVAAALGAAAVPAFAAEQSGTAVAVRQSATATGEGGQRALQAAGPVFMNDTINTTSSGQAQIELLDQTRLVVGPNSSMVIDQFVYSGNSAANRVSINVTKGAFRFITGLSPKKAYSIKTPTATIGVRGTQLDVAFVNGVTSFALFEGSARVCDLRNRCIDFSRRCEAAIVPAQNDMQRLSPGSATTRYLGRNFPYIASQASLLPNYRVDTSGCGYTGGDAGATPASGPGANPSPSPPSDGGEEGGEGGSDFGGEGGSDFGGEGGSDFGGEEGGEVGG